MPDVMPTAADKPHITLLAQVICDAVQDYARTNGMTFPGVMSAIGTAAGALLARAYDDPAVARRVASRLSIAAGEMASAAYLHDPLIRARTNTTEH